jgi:hypothetical protein
MQLYSQTALAFPTQTLSFQPINGNLFQAGSLSLTLPSTPRFVHAIFILFPLTNEYRKVYVNPMLKEWTLKMGGYGQVPDISTSTTSAKFYELCANALNMNNDSQGFNEEVMKSLVLVNDSDAVEGNHSNDITNFFIGIPVETNHTFQQGQTSNSAIAYYFNATQDPLSQCVGNMTAPPIMGFLKDSVLAIQLREGGTPLFLSTSLTSQVRFRYNWMNYFSI